MVLLRTLVAGSYSRSAGTGNKPLMGLTLTSNGVNGVLGGTADS